jgi:hypothetical protein
MKKKLGPFFVGYIVSILIMYIIPILIIYPNIMNTIKVNSNQINLDSEYAKAYNKIRAANLEGELNTINEAKVSSLKSQSNVRNYIIIFYANMIFITLFIIGLLCMKKDDFKKFLGKGIICGVFVGAAGITATIIFSSSYFIL